MQQLTTDDKLSQSSCVDAWSRELKRNRRRIVAVSGRKSVADEFTRLRHRFDQLMFRSKQLFKEHCLARREVDPLRRLASKVLAISKLVYTELKQADSENEPVAPVGMVERLFELSQQLIDRLNQQLGLFDRTDDYANHLHEAVEELMHSKVVSAVTLRNLARRIIVDVEASSTSGLMFPDWGRSLRQTVTQRARISDTYVYSGGIQTARVLVCCAHGCQQLNEYLEQLVVASLLQDIGLLVLEQAHHSTPDQLEIEQPGVYGEHPCIGAAVAAGVKAFTVELPFLVAGHHERLDGTGFPRGLQQSAFVPALRLLAVVVRFVELLDDFVRAIDQEHDEIGRREDAVPPAATQLFREAKQGEFDLELTEQLLDSLSPGLLPRLKAAPSELNMVQQVETSGQFIRFHAAHFRRHQRYRADRGQPTPTVPKPNFAARIKAHRRTEV